MSHNAPFCNRNVHMCAHFCYEMVHCGIFVWCIVGFVRWISWRLIVRDCGYYFNVVCSLTHWGRVTHICVSRQIIIGSDNGLSPGRRQAIIWTNAGILLIRPLGTNFSEILIEIHMFSLKKIHLKMSSGKWWPFCLGLNVLKPSDLMTMAAISQTTFSNAFSWMKIMILWFMQISLKPFLKGPIETMSQLI